MKKILFLVLGFTLVMGAGASALVASDLIDAPLELSTDAASEPTPDDSFIEDVVVDDAKVEPSAATDPFSDEPKDEEEPKDEPKEEPKDEEPKDEPKEEPKDEEPADTTPPEIHILSPDNGAIVHEAKIRFSGETEPGAKVFVGDWYADVTDDGRWTLVLILEKGSNTVKFTAKDKAGNTATASTTVIYEPVFEEPKEEEPKDEEPKDEEVDFKFTANQKYGSCGEAIPYDVFWGTAKPGATIYVESPYGGGTTTASEKGHWELKVKFPEAPVGTFGVVVESSDGGRAEFSFTVIEKVYEFSVHQKWEASEEPWNVYWGTGTPGTAVNVSSEYGSGATEVNDHGEWELKVTFEAPANTPFNVSISHGDTVKTLTFKHKVLVD